MLGFDEDIAFKVWGYTENRVKARDIAQIIKITLHTVQRLQAVRNGFSKNRAVKELATKEWNVATIELLHIWWRHYNKDKIVHIRQLINIVFKLRNRIINPKLDKRLYGKLSTFQWGKQDWRISPSAWFTVMAWGQDENRFDENFKYFREHLVDYSFFKHYDQLKKDALAFENKIDKAAKKIKNHNLDIYNKITKTVIYLTDFCLEHTYDPDERFLPMDFKPLHFKKSDYDGMIKELTAYIPDYQSRLINLEKLLQQVWDDLAPAKIIPEIQTSKCSRGY